MFAFTYPPLSLRDISPARGEIVRASFPAGLDFELSAIAMHERKQNSKLVISPLAGEMSDRTEGGKVKHENDGLICRLLHDCP